VFLPGAILPRHAPDERSVNKRCRPSSGGRPLGTFDEASSTGGERDREQEHHMPNLNVTYGEMQDAATRLVNGEQDITSKLRELKSLVDSLISGGYVTDQSSVAFGNSYQEFNDGATKTIEGLEGMSMYLNKAAEALQQTDTELANAIK
jgi:WXG100 family type VII secretion target